MEGLDITAGAETAAPVNEAPAPVAEPAAPAEPASDPYAGFGRDPAPAAPANDWRTALPESIRDAVKDVSSMEDVQAALKRGLDYVPPSSADDVRLSFPEGTEVDADVNKSFRELCAKAGINSRMAQALSDWQLEQVKASISKASEACESSLRQEWGGRFDERAEQAKRAVIALDRRMGGTGELANALANSGAWAQPSVRKAFQAIGSLIGEDTLSAGSGASSPSSPESPEQTYSRFFK